MSFNKYWKLYLNKYEYDLNCIPNYNKECEKNEKSISLDDFKYIYTKPIFENEHKIEYNYAN
jgi:hypothetical protein